MNRNRPAPSPSQAADAIGDLVAFAVSRLPEATRKEIAIALTSGKGVLEITAVARSPVDFECRTEFFNGKRKRLLSKIPMSGGQ